MSPYNHIYGPMLHEHEWNASTTYPSDYSRMLAPITYHLNLQWSD